MACTNCVQNNISRDVYFQLDCRAHMPAHLSCCSRFSNWLQMQSEISHYGAKFDLSHLDECSRTLHWKCQDGKAVEFRTQIKFSNHCISEEINGCAPNGAHCFTDRGGKRRVFDIERFQWSLQLPEIIDRLFDEPTTTVRLTIERNWFLFQLHMQHPLPNGEKYYCFLRMRYLRCASDDPPQHDMHLHVESAYSRSRPPLTPHGNQRSMFGRLAERLMLEKN